MQKISVIVPVYKTENYLKKCLDSIINQIYNNFEVIIVNDGSTDNSELIVSEYLKEYPDKIKYYKKENGGLSDARNYGVERATGDYICFVDSDDYIDINLFENLKIEMDKQTQLIKYKIIKVDSKYNEIERVNGPVFSNITGLQAFEYLMGKDVLLEVACLYLYKRDFYIENNFQFSKGLYHEDFGLLPLIITKAITVSSIDYYGYYYYMSDDSITRNVDYKKTRKRIWDMLEHYDNMLKLIDNDESLNNKAILNIKLYYTNSIILKLKELNKEDRKKYIYEIKQRKMIKNIKPRNLKQLLKRLALNMYFGLTNT